MRNGEIVRTDDGRIIRVNPTGTHADDLAHIVTIKEFFAAAGHPVPKGTTKITSNGYSWECWGEDRVCLAVFIRDGHEKLLPNTPQGWFVNHTVVAEHVASWEERKIDLSRLPALDAWDALPEVIKKGVDENE